MFSMSNKLKYKLIDGLLPGKCGESCHLITKTLELQCWYRDITYDLASVGDLPLPEESLSVPESSPEGVSESSATPSSTTPVSLGQASSSAPMTGARSTSHAVTMFRSTLVF